MEALTMDMRTSELNAFYQFAQRRLAGEAADALHVTAVKSVGAQEFVTAEKSTSALFRVAGISIRTFASVTPTN
jgi:hypothetical protein